MRKDKGFRYFLFSCKKIGFLHTLNNLSYDYGMKRTLPFTERQEHMIERFVARKNFINRLIYAWHQMLYGED